MSKENHSYKVHFLPHDREIVVQEGTTVLEAAHEANVYISSICGGMATCGKCKVVVEEGHVESPPTILLSPEELTNNYILACQARVTSNLLISIPPETRIEGGQILLSSEETLGVTAGKIHGLLPGVEYKHDPLVKKIFLELEPPTLDDNLPDYERLKRAIMLKEGISMEALEAGLEILKGLPACLRQNREDRWRITATVAQHGLMQEIIHIELGDTTQAGWGLAVDVGTTTIVTELLNLATGKALDIEATYNSQMKWGEDYIQRIMYAQERNALEDLQKSVIKDINGLLSILLARNHLKSEDIKAITCSGNTAMIHFLLVLDPTLIRKEPYIATANFIPTLKANELGIKIYRHSPLYCLPSVAAYVGGDITGGAMAIGLDQEEVLCLFIDIGTNGEVVLGNKEWMVCCSASAGPSFEGSGVRHGMRAASGAIERLDIAEDLSLSYKIIGNGTPRGICGSGLLDTIAALLRSGAINKSGKLIKGNTPRIRETEE
ncbi:MAG TPA: ASKHA domain-containing protein, partial [Candidatus Hypogeohydataceae bacterium YC40]